VRIVIADDSALFRGACGALLSEAGHDVVAAVGAANALLTDPGCRRRRNSISRWFEIGDPGAISCPTMATTGRHAYRPSAARRTLLTVAVLCLAVFALAVGCRSAIVDRIGPTDDTLSVFAGTSSTTAGVSTTDLSTSPGVGASTTAAPPSTTPTPTPTPTSAAAPPAVPQPGSLTDVAQALLDQINAWRAADGKAPLTMASGLVASAHKHNLVMSAGCRLQHQCPNESSLGARISAEGVSWRAVGENIAWHSSVSSGGVLAAAKGLNESMHNEIPPNDGHRRNMLNDAYHRIGIDVIRDANGEVWVTEDFAN
jgi:uncharacterized protein YkwD